MKVISWPWGGVIVAQFGQISELWQNIKKCIKNMLLKVFFCHISMVKKSPNIRMIFPLLSGNFVKLLAVHPFRYICLIERKFDFCELLTSKLSVVQLSGRNANCE